MPLQFEKTPLYENHAAMGGHLVDFAGWSMPVRYRSIVEEHKATRGSVGIFDISHMGRLDIGGSDALKLLDRVLTRRVTDLKEGRIRYSLVCNEAGGVLDDVLVYHLPEAPGTPLKLVVNANNRAKIVDWLAAHRGSLDADVVVDRTHETAMIAVQGPRAAQLLSPHVDADLGSMKYYTGGATNLGEVPVTISRTGYTGEDGFELVVDADDAPQVWEKIVDAAAKFGGLPVGLGARDTLRLEAALPLYGHELSDEINPVMAGLRFAYNLEDREFIGRDAIAGFENDENQKRLVGLTLGGKRVPREGYNIEADGKVVGEVTSGTFSPTRDRPIALAYVEPRFTAVGTALAVHIRGRLEGATVVPTPFYKREKSPSP